MPRVWQNSRARWRSRLDGGWAQWYNLCCQGAPTVLTIASGPLRREAVFVSLYSYQYSPIHTVDNGGRKTRRVQGLPGQGGTYFLPQVGDGLELSPEEVYTDAFDNCIESGKNGFGAYCHDHL